MAVNMSGMPAMSKLRRWESRGERYLTSRMCLFENSIPPLRAFYGPFVHATAAKAWKIPDIFPKSFHASLSLGILGICKSQKQSICLNK